MILADNKLYCFEDQFTLDSPTGVLDLKNAGSVVNIQIAETGGPGMRIHVKNESWTITWDLEEPVHVRKMWARKFLRALPEVIVEKLDHVDILQ
jgi:hypothetical protein